MFKKLLVVATLVLGISVVSSCSKDDEPNPPDKAKENVAGTDWMATRYSAAYYLTFDRAGGYTLEKQDGVYSKGSYSQSGTTITFTEKTNFGLGLYFSKGTISNAGTNLTIPMTYWDGSDAGSMKFLLMIDKK